MPQDLYRDRVRDDGILERRCYTCFKWKPFVEFRLLKKKPKGVSPLELVDSPNIVISMPKYVKKSRSGKCFMCEGPK